jgi:hypothetical protein
MRTLLCLLLAAGCSENGKQLLARIHDPIFALYAGLRSTAAKLPPSPVDEVGGGALQPPAVFGVAGNTRFMPLARLADGAEVCAADELEGALERWLDRSMPGTPAAAKVEQARGDEARTLRAEADSVVAARYVVLYRMIGCPAVTQVEAFVYDVNDNKVVRTVRVAVSAPTPAAVHDRLLGALAGRAGVDVRVPSSAGGVLARITQPEPPAARAPVPTQKVARCYVDTPEAEIEDPGGGMPCAEAEKLATDLRAKGFAAKVIPIH